MSLSTPSTSVPKGVAVAHDATSQAALAARRTAFRTLHERGCFVIPNPWDVGSARYLQHLGFPALATTSAGFAFSQGLPDSGDDAVVSRDRNLAYIADITAAVDVPVSADFMSGYGMTPEDVAESVTRCVATGVAGLSIEDATGNASSPLYDLPIAVERVRAARQAIDRIRRGRAADRKSRVLPRGPSGSLPRERPAPAGVRRSRRRRALRAGSTDARRDQGARRGGRAKPLNLLVVRDIGLSVEEIAALGVRRISVGGALALAAWTGFMRAAQTLKSEGSFAGLASLVHTPRLTASLRPIFLGTRPGDGRATEHRALRMSSGAPWATRAEGLMPSTEVAQARGLWQESDWGPSMNPGHRLRVRSNIRFRFGGPVDDHWGRSESLDPDNVGDIADEGVGHRG